MNIKKRLQALAGRGKEEHVTLILIPGKTAYPINLGFPSKYVKWSAAALIGFLLSVMILTYVYLSSQGEIRQVRALQEGVRQQQQEIEHLNREIRDFENQRAVIEQKQNEIKQMMGLKPPSGDRVETTSRGGQGGWDRAYDPEAAGEGELDLPDLNRLQTDLDRMEKELEDLQTRVRGAEKYYLALPNLFPAEGSITSGFGWRRSPFGGSGQAFHDGIDIANQPGTDILAAADGKVIYSGWMSVYGRTVMIDHGYGFTTKYGHNSRLLVKEGQEVRKGDVIALMGTTGLSTGPHLHFSVYCYGTPQDPLIYLPQQP